MPRTMPSAAEEFHFDGFDSPNGTIVPDLFFDELMPYLKEAELRVLLYIIRRTFGFKKNADPISFSQFLSGITAKDGRQLDNGCGIKSRSHLNNALKSLEAKGIITTHKERGDKGEPLITTYALRFKTTGNKGSTQKALGGSTQKALGVVPQKHLQETVIQETDNNSNIREAQPQNRKPGGTKSGREEPVATQPTVSYEEFQRIQQQIHTKPPEQSREEQPKPEGLTRHYLSAARTRASQQPNTDGLASIASMLSKPEPTSRKRTYTEERQVLVDVISDLAREFRDEAKLTESVTRAYNLMGKAGITDVGVFVSKMYEARSITKERYGTITRRMPYFFSVLTDVCGLKPKNSTQNLPSE